MIQLFFRNNGELAYGRSRHYNGRKNDKPTFSYHQQSLGYIQRKLNEMPKDVYSQIMGQIGQINNDDLDEVPSSTILEKSWASSSVRIEHQPPKLGVEGSNPSPPAIFSGKF